MDSSNNHEQFKLILELHKESAIIREVMAEVKADLREHMKRTAIIETELKWLHRQIWIAHGAIGLIGIIGGLAGLIKLLL